MTMQVRARGHFVYTKCWWIRMQHQLYSTLSSSLASMACLAHLRALFLGEKGREEFFFFVLLLEKEYRRTAGGKIRC